jgi:hypothetical protein
MNPRSRSVRNQLNELVTGICVEIGQSGALSVQAGNTVIIFSLDYRSTALRLRPDCYPLILTSHCSPLLVTWLYIHKWYLYCTESCIQSSPVCAVFTCMKPPLAITDQLLSDINYPWKIIDRSEITTYKIHTPIIALLCCKGSVLYFKLNQKVHLSFESWHLTFYRCFMGHKVSLII